MSTEANLEDQKHKQILIKGGFVVNSESLEVADVLVQEGKIAQIGKDLAYDKTSTIVIDATGKYVMPGGIDPHVHMELKMPTTTSKDDFYTGSAAALAGGTTMIIDFINSEKNKSLLESYEERLEEAKKCACDYAFHLTVPEFNERVAKEMEILIKEKKVVNSIKTFFAYSHYMLNDGEFIEVVKKALEFGAVTMLHAENGYLVEEGQKKMLKLGIAGPEGHALSRPDYVECEAAHRGITICGAIGAPLYIVHVMSKSVMDEISKGKLKGYRVVGEPVLSSLVLDDSVYKNENWDEAAKFVMSPPLRSKEDMMALQRGLKSGVLDLVGTDHCSFDMEQKRMGRDDFTKIPNGVHGVEDRMGLLWDRLVHTGMIRPQDYVRITSTEAAQIFNIYPQKGAIKVGSDADIIILNPKATKIISAKTHHQNIDFNVFEGWKQNGVIETTIARGIIVWHDGKLNAVRGAGRFIKTPPFGKMFDGLDQELLNNQPTGIKRQ